jgi:hypothetical protein
MTGQNKPHVEPRAMNEESKIQEPTQFAVTTPFAAIDASPPQPFMLNRQNQVPYELRTATTIPEELAKSQSEVKHLLPANAGDNGGPRSVLNEIGSELRAMNCELSELKAQELRAKSQDKWKEQRAKEQAE